MAHTGLDAWIGDYVRVVFDDGSYRSCYSSNLQVYNPNIVKTALALDNDQYAYLPCY